MINWQLGVAILFGIAALYFWIKVLIGKDAMQGVVDLFSALLTTIGTSVMLLTYNI